MRGQGFGVGGGRVEGGGRGGGSGLTSDTSDPSVPVTRLSSDGGLM